MAMISIPSTSWDRALRNARSASVWRSYTGMTTETRITDQRSRGLIIPAHCARLPTRGFRGKRSPCLLQRYGLRNRATGIARSGTFMLQALDATTGAATPHSGAALWLALRTLRNLRKGLAWAWLDNICQYSRSKIMAHRRMRRDLAFCV